MTDTLFFAPSMSVFPENVSDPTYSQWADRVIAENYYQHTLRRVDSTTLALVGDSYTLPLFGTLAWNLFIIGCQGRALVETVGVDTDNSTTINGYTPIRGSAVNPTYPGYLLLSTYNLSSVTIVAQDPNTALQIFSILATEDAT